MLTVEVEFTLRDHYTKSNVLYYIITLWVIITVSLDKCQFCKWNVSTI